MFKLAPFLLGSIAAAGIGAGFSLPPMDIIRGAGGHSPDHRSPGGRAHRRWRKLRSAGRR